MNRRASSGSVCFSMFYFNLYILKSPQAPILNSELSRSSHAALLFTSQMSSLATAKTMLSEDESIFDLTGPREMLTKEMAIEYFGVIKHPEKVHKICFSTKSFGDDAAEIAASAIVKMTNLKVADLSDFIAGRETSIGLRVLNKVSTALAATQLVELDLSENALGPRGVESCRPLLASKDTLESLSFCNDGLSAEAMEIIQRLLLFRGTDNPTRLKTLRFHNNMSGSGGAVAISKVLEQSPLLEHFELSSTRCGREGGLCLCKALGNCPNLKSVNVCDNTFGAEGGEVLAQSLIGKTSLEILKVGDVTLEDQGTHAILKILSDSRATSALRILSLEANDITFEGLQCLQDVFRRQTKLERLILDDNCDLGSRGALRVSRALKFASALNTLSMKSCDLKRAGAVAIVESLKPRKETSGQTLTVLLDENRISEEGVTLINDMFATDLQGSAVLGPLDDNDDEASEDEEFDDDDVEADVSAENASAAANVEDDIAGTLDKLSL
jgi:Ran GTPase-activating protein 1